MFNVKSGTKNYNNNVTVKDGCTEGYIDTYVQKVTMRQMYRRLHNSFIVESEGSPHLGCLLFCIVVHQLKQARSLKSGI
jgi:hypothetical protein